MPKFKFGVVMDLAEAQTARLADGASGSATQLAKEDNDKFVKLIGDSQYGLCAVGNEIEGVVSVANDIAPGDGFNLGSIINNVRARVKVTLDGLQATPGTGTLVVGDYVVCGTVTARGTVLPGPPKVCKATAAATGIVFKWRVVSFISGTGAVGQTALIERVS
jgi:hypothetical protein